jgi:hypothetical protein
MHKRYDAIQFLSIKVARMGYTPSIYLSQGFNLTAFNGIHIHSLKLKRSDFHYRVRLIPPESWYPDECISTH